MRTIIQPTMTERLVLRENKYHEINTHRGAYPGAMNKSLINRESFKGGHLSAEFSNIGSATTPNIRL